MKVIISVMLFGLVLMSCGKQTTKVGDDFIDQLKHDGRDATQQDIHEKIASGEMKEINVLGNSLRMMKVLRELDYPQSHIYNGTVFIYGYQCVLQFHPRSTWPKELADLDRKRWKTSLTDQEDRRFQDLYYDFLLGHFMALQVVRESSLQ